MTAENLEPHFARPGGDPVRDAFAARRAVLPWRIRGPLPADESRRPGRVWCAATGRLPRMRLASPMCMTLTTAGRFCYSNLIFAFDAILCPGAPAPVAGPSFVQNPHRKRELS